MLASSAPQTCLFMCSAATFRREHARALHSARNQSTRQLEVYVEVWDLWTLNRKQRPSIVRSAPSSEQQAAASKGFRADAGSAFHPTLERCKSPVVRSLSGKESLATQLMVSIPPEVLAKESCHVIGWPSNLKQSSSRRNARVSSSYQAIATGLSPVSFSSEQAKHVARSTRTGGMLTRRTIALSLSWRSTHASVESTPPSSLQVLRALNHTAAHRASVCVSQDPGMFGCSCFSRL